MGPSGPAGRLGRPSARQPLLPIDDPQSLPSRDAALQRRAMQAALANAVRAMRSTRRGSIGRGSYGVPPAGRA